MVRDIHTLLLNQTVQLMRDTHLFRMVLVLLLVPFLASCDLESDDPHLDPHGNDPSPSSTIIGQWELQSMVDKTGTLLGGSNRSVTAGTATTFSVDNGGQTFQAVFLIDGGIVFTSDRYEVTLSTTITISGVGSNSDTTVDTGSYTIDGGTMTITSDTPDPDDPGPIVLSWSMVDNTLSLEDEESRMVFSR